MDDIIRKNLKLLSRSHPSISDRILKIGSAAPYRLTQDPKPNILLKSRSFHSKENPEKEALNLVRDLNVQKGFLYLFLGIGLGYHIELFKNLYREAGQTTIIAVEKSVEAFALLLRQRDASFLHGMHLFINEDSGALERFFHTLDPLSFKGYRIIRLRGACSFFPDYYSEIEASFKQVMSGKLSDVLTRFAFESLWMKNILKNLPFLCGKSPINSLRGMLSGKTVLVIAAGPSLADQLDLIRRLSLKLHIVSVDTAVEPLLLSGIVPDFIMTLDGQYFTLSHFRSIMNCSGTIPGSILIADLVSQPLVVKNWPGRLFFSTSSSQTPQQMDEINPLARMLSEQYMPVHPLPCGGSVATSAIEFALFLGSSSVIVTGLDLSYTFFRTHVISSANDLYYSRASHRLAPENTWISRAIHGRNLCSVSGIDGGQVVSDFVFRNYIDWFSQKGEYPQKVYNATERGAYVPGLKRIHLEELFRKKAGKNPIALPNIPSPETLSKEACLHFLRSVEQEVIAAGTTVEILQNGPFPYGPFPYGSIPSRPSAILRNILTLALSIHRNKKSACTSLQLLLDILARLARRSIEKLEKGHH